MYPVALVQRGVSGIHLQAVVPKVFKGKGRLTVIEPVLAVPVAVYIQSATHTRPLVYPYAYLIAMRGSYTKLIAVMDLVIKVYNPAIQAVFPQKEFLEPDSWYRLYIIDNIGVDEIHIRHYSLGRGSILGAQRTGEQRKE